MNWDEIKSRFRPGTLFIGIVKRVTPSHAIVELDDGVVGRIPHYEIDWKEESADPREHFEAGDVVTGVIFGYQDEERQLVLSTRRREFDPWEGVEARYPVGGVVTGRVMRKYRGSFFVEIQRGLEAYLPKEDLENLPDTLYPEDTVEVVVTEVSVRTRQMRVSVAQRVHRAERASQEYFVRQQATKAKSSGQTLGEIATIVASAQSRQRERAMEAAARGPHGQRPLRILLLENDPTVLSSLGEALSRAGHSVTGTMSPLEAAELGEEIGFDVTLLDFDVPLLSGRDVAERILRKRPDALVILFSGVDISVVEEAVGSLAVHAILPKPISVEQIEDSANAIKATRRALRRESEEESHPSPAPVSESMGWAFGGSEDLGKSLLSDLHARTHAKCVVLFHMDPGTLKTSVMFQSSGSEIKETHAFDDLRYSDVYNVALEGQELIDNEASQNLKRYRYLEPIIAFGSCIGLPVRCFSRQEWALFVFGEKPGDLGEAKAEMAKSAAIALRSAMETQSVATGVTHTDRWVTRGQIAASFAHEVFNRLTIAGSDGMSLPQATEAARRATKEGTMSDLPRLVDRIEETNRGLLDICDLMRGWLASVEEGEKAKVDVNAVVSGISRLFSYEAARCYTALETELSSEFFYAAVPSTTLVQVLINLVLNAIQQIGEKGLHLGHVSIKTFRVPDPEFPIRVQVADNGPGIHKAYWERIFEPLFTTRKGGSGLGLYISQLLLGQYGSRVFVESSTMFIGTTMTVALREHRRRRE